MKIKFKRIKNTTNTKTQVSHKCNRDNNETSNENLLQKFCCHPWCLSNMLKVQFCNFTKHGNAHEKGIKQKI